MVKAAGCAASRLYHALPAYPAGGRWEGRARGFPSSRPTGEVSGRQGGRRPETTTAGAFLTGSEEAAAHTPSEHLRTHVRQPWRKEPRSARRVHGTPATPQPARPDRFPDSKPRGRLVLTCGGSDDEVRQRGTRVVGDHVVLQGLRRIGHIVGDPGFAGFQR